MTTLPQYTPYYGGGQVANPANVIGTSGAPSSVLTESRLGTIAVDNASGNIYGLASKVGNVNTWVLLGGSSGAVASVLGTANQITANTVGNVVTLSLPVAITAPGSLTTTTSLSATTTVTGGTGVTATTGNIAASSGNVSASGTVTGGTGVTATTGNVSASAGNVQATGNVLAVKSAAGANVTVQATNSDNTSGASNGGVEIATGGASSGDPYLSFQISGVGASTMTMGLDNSASDLFVISNSAAIGTSNALTLSQAGALNATTSVTAGTSLTATLGDITATNGNFVASTAGTGLSLPVATASGVSPQTANARVFSVTFTGVSIASGATQAFDIANTAIVGASTVALVQWSGATAGSALSIVSQVSSAGHLTITMTNGTSATMVTSTADITFTGIVLN